MADKKISQLTGATTPLTGTEELAIVQGGSTVKATAQDVADLAGGGIGGTNYIYVMADGTPTQNATELQAAYTTAQGMSPSITNKITIVAAPGYYTFGGSPFTMDTEYINLVSLDGNRSILITSGTSLGINVTANNVYVKGVNTQNKSFSIGDNLNLITVENCIGGNGSFSSLVVSGTFIDCEAGDESFAGTLKTASGIFTNCKSGNNSFGSVGVASGTFTNCTGVDACFGGGGGIASGTFINCVGNDSCFGQAGTASGTFRNCRANNISFGAFFGTASGTFINCEGGNNSFGNGAGAALTGKLYYCRLTTGTFQTVSGGGKTRLCIDGNDSENNQG